MSKIRNREDEKLEDILKKKNILIEDSHTNLTEDAYKKGWIEFLYDLIYADM